MAVIAEFTLPPAAFPLGRVFEDVPAARLELDRVVPSGDTVMPYFWVHAPEGALPQVQRRLDMLPELRAADLLEDLGDKGLFRAEWEPAYIGIMGAVEASGVTVLSASGSTEGWIFELRARSNDDLSHFQEHCEAEEIPVELTRLTRLTDTAVGDDLTAEQHEALVLAYREGYYDDPRRTDQESLAEALDISRQALGARLRRAYRTLIERAVLAEDGAVPVEQ